MKKGFTLLEILIVVAIVGCLAAIAIPSFQKAKKDIERNEHIKVERVTYDPVKSVSQPLECSQVLEIDGVKVYRFRSDVTKEWTYLTITTYGGPKASIGH